MLVRMPADSHAPASASPQLARTIDERANFCFGCGPDNPQGLRLRFDVHGDDPANITARTTVTLERVHEGPPGHIHGGMIAVLFDEVMSKLNRPLNVLAMTRNLNVDYLRPCPLYVPLELSARHIRQDGRKIFHEGTLALADGTELARAQGFFLAIPPELLAQLDQQRGA